MFEQFNDRQQWFAREQMLYLYTSALERGDFETVASVLAKAENDPLLEHLILELHEAQQAEEDTTAEPGAAEVVRRLLRQCIPSGFIDEAEIELPPLTVSDVLGRLQSDGSLRAFAEGGEQAAIQRLRQSDEALPSDLSKRNVRQLFERIGVSLSAAFQRLFRETAIFLSMGREQQAAQLAAARRQKQASKNAAERKELK